MITIEDVTMYLLTGARLQALAERFFNENVKTLECEIFQNAIFGKSVRIMYSTVDYMDNPETEEYVISYEELLSFQFLK